MFRAWFSFPDDGKGSFYMVFSAKESFVDVRFVCETTAERRIGK